MFRDNRRGGFGGGFRRQLPDLPKPVEIGKEYDVEISEVGSRGDGIARINNFVIFVPNTKQGEKVKVNIKSLGRSFAVGERVDGASAASEAPAAENGSALAETEDVAKDVAEKAGVLDEESEDAEGTESEEEEV